MCRPEKQGNNEQRDSAIEFWTEPVISRVEATGAEENGAGESVKIRSQNQILT